jgi:hypothetical protein
MLQGGASPVDKYNTSLELGHCAHSITRRLINTPVSHLIAYVGNAALCMVAQYLSEVEHVYVASVKKFMLIILRLIILQCPPIVLLLSHWVCVHTRMLTGYGMSEESVNSQS